MPSTFVNTEKVNMEMDSPHPIHFEADATSAAAFKFSQKTPQSIRRFQPCLCCSTQVPDVQEPPCLRQVHVTFGLG